MYLERTNRGGLQFIEQGVKVSEQRSVELFTEGVDLNHFESKLVFALLLFGHLLLSGWFLLFVLLWPSRELGQFICHQLIFSLVLQQLLLFLSDLQSSL